MTARKPPPAPSKQLPLPSTDEVLFLSGMAILAGVTVIEWPIALGIGVAHLATKRVFGRKKK